MRWANRRERLRHQAITEWRGVEDGPLMDSHAQNLGAIIPQILKTWKLDERLREDDVAAAWEGIVGSFNARHTAPDGLKRGVLTVRVLQPALHHTLMMQKGALLKRLQERFGEKEIKDLRFRHG
jgi:predicted nucleic acid-binding Zn ribbon protein